MYHIGEGEDWPQWMIDYLEKEMAKLPTEYYKFELPPKKRKKKGYLFKNDAGLRVVEISENSDDPNPIAQGICLGVLNEKGEPPLLPLEKLVLPYTLIRTIVKTLHNI